MVGIISAKMFKPGLIPGFFLSLFLLIYRFCLILN
ncbi:hypothetical protein SPAB_00952 [Salmonella enterica subsp. enterica serovar Paratyphi B str. SPB7]|uniref:Uncharacterized protein n=1 Tax=Salmonella paratyphi B (strain ATCC BAA-1250 / SPB7) TaxID=1016998 RepID=A0A6C6YZD9_SALPB|nr:hypothetical protein SPAB_00952 [Salmonella enterica subsp. enterica serovar Paratyphi B str. SPB7]